MVELNKISHLNNKFSKINDIQNKKCLRLNLSKYQYLILTQVFTLVMFLNNYTFHWFSLSCKIQNSIF